MKPFAFQLRRALWCAAACVPLWAGAAPLLPGNPMAALVLEDQHGKPVALNASTQLLVFTAEKAPSDFVNQVFKGQSAGVLDRLQAIYIADISAMPSIVTRMFALPKLRELPFQIGLAREAAAVADLPRRPGAASVLTLKDGQVTQVRYAQTEAELRQALGLAP